MIEIQTLGERFGSLILWRLWFFWLWFWICRSGLYWSFWLGLDGWSFHYRISNALDEVVCAELGDDPRALEQYKPCAVPTPFVSIKLEGITVGCLHFEHLVSHKVNSRSR